MGKCVKCGKQSEKRRLTDSLCATFLKVKTKTVVNVPTCNFLKAVALTQLPKKQDIGPDDSFSIIVDKR
jgi:hypothetical protein